MLRAALISLCLLWAICSPVEAVERGGPGSGNWHGSSRHGGPNWHRDHRNDDIAGRIIGGFLGGLVGSILRPEPEPPAVVIVQPPAQEAAPGPAPWTQEWYDYCNGKYKSFDARTGYFTGFDGIQHFCN